MLPIVSPKGTPCIAYRVTSNNMFIHSPLKLVGSCASQPVSDSYHAGTTVSALWCTPAA